MATETLMMMICFLRRILTLTTVPAREIPVEAARAVEGGVQICHARDVPARDMPVEAARGVEGSVQTRHPRDVREGTVRNSRRRSKWSRNLHRMWSIRKLR